MERVMTQIFNPTYKEIVEKIAKYNLSQLDKATLILQELLELKNDNGDHTIDDYATIAKAAIEGFLGNEIMEQANA
jgi:hypothetical protein